MTPDLLAPRDVSSLVRKTSVTVWEHIQDGRFQSSLCAVACVSSLVSGLEVGYEHYKGSYGNRMMYTPVILSGALTIAAGWGTFSEKAARSVMRWTSITTLVDGAAGFIFHIRGIARKPGGWRLPLTNIIMGPPIFAPLLFGTAAYLGIMASYLRRENSRPEQLPEPELQGWRGDIQQGRFQRQVLVVSLIWAAFSGFEAWYSHYKSGFRIWAQWTPVILAPIHILACLLAMRSERMARTLLPVSSALATLDGTIGFGYHVRGVVRRPGGTKTWLYNILYGPPIFAPLLFAACGTLGLLAAMLRREKTA